MVGIPGLHAGLPEVVERVKPSVVAVGTFQKTRSPPFLFRGTGFAVGDGTLIVTNAHVLPDAPKADTGETLVVVVRAPGTGNTQPREVKSIVSDPEHDLALLSVSGAALPALKIGDSDTVREGQTIAFTGFPIGHVLGFHATTHRGVVAAVTPFSLPAPTAAKLEASAAARLKGSPMDMFQLDATVFPGHSGSPLYDEDSGEVLGVVNMGLARGIKDPVIGQTASITFAIPARYLRELMARTTR